MTSDALLPGDRARWAELWRGAAFEGMIRYEVAARVAGEPI